MGERMVGGAEVRGREGLAWLAGVASLRRDTPLMVRQVLAWVQAVEVQRGEARDEAAAAEARCDELEQQVAQLRDQVARLREVDREKIDSMEEVKRVAEKLVKREQAAQAEAAALRAEVERLRAAGGAA